MLNRWIGWIEESSGIDITPCHDADGTWDPGPDCGHFATSLDRTTGTWATGCSAPGAVSAGPSQTCGADAPAAADGGTPEADAASVPPPAPEAPPPDAAVPAPDAAPAPPLEPVADAHPDVATTPVAPTSGPGGCSCDVGRRRAPASCLAAVLAALLVGLRRRRRDQAP
jgi:hypothetical protein